MSIISNTITMLYLLSTGRKYSTKELATILEVTPRRIRSYKEELEKAGIYIDSIMGPNGGYVLNQSLKIPERKFSKEDYLLLDKCISNSSTESEKEKLKLLKEKIEGIYIIKENTKLDADTLSKYNLLTRAIKEKRKVKILYDSFQKGENERVINPAEMFLFKDGWYCAAFCELRKDIRHFELKRIKEITLLDEKF